MTDYKQLCADLLAWAEKASSHYYSQPSVIIRARAALAEPDPEGLKEQALSILDDASDQLDAAHENIIRRALEQLPDDQG